MIHKPPEKEFMEAAMEHCLYCLLGSSKHDNHRSHSKMLQKYRIMMEKGRKPCPKS